MNIKTGYFKNSQVNIVYDLARLQDDFLRAYLEEIERTGDEC